jgi:LPXTG-motif cell wall-anchored protein
VKLVYTANPDDGSTGETTEKTVYVFTYQLDGTKVDGAKPATKLPGAKFKLKKGENEFYKVTNGIVSWVPEGEATEVTSDDQGLFNFIGLDQGTYTLIETVAPQGYNKANSTVTITATLNDTSITVLNTETTEEILNAGKVSVQVENNKGAVLPETGGIGTTMFYVIGAALVIGAGVVLVSKKRMEVK